MNQSIVDISGFDLINGAEALKILEIEHKSGLSGIIKAYKIPHKTISGRKVFAREDIQLLKDS